MQTNILKKGLLGLALGIFGCSLYAASPIEGFWKSIDDRTGEPLSIIEIKKEANGTFSGTIVHRYSNARGVTLTTCAKCPPPYKDKPILGLKILTNFEEESGKPGHYTNGTVLDAKSGGIYKGKASVSTSGRQLKMRGYVGVSMFGRSNVWIRTDSANP